MTAGKPSKSLSHFSADPGDDPLEAIYALNIGDFVTESFISEELLSKISQRLADDPEKLKAQLDELVQIYSMDKTLGILGFEPSHGFIIYDSVCRTLVGMMQIDACHLFQMAHKDNGDTFLSLCGASTEVDPHQRWEIGLSLKQDDWLGDVVRQGKRATVSDVSTLRNWHPIQTLEQNKTRSLLALPLKEGSKTIGLLLLERHTQSEFEPELLSLAEATAQVYVTAMRLQQLVAQVHTQSSERQVKTSTLLNLRAEITESIADLGIHQQAFIETLAAAVDARNHFTRGHSKAVATIAQAIAEAMELNEKTVDLVYMSGLMGSIGKVNIPKSILNKSGQLNPAEWEALRNHPNVGVSLLGKINFLSETTPYVQSQKERWDGSGSPEGLKGRSIPLGARILAVADAYYAMTQERPYRNQQPMTHVQAIQALQQEAGIKWDPTVVDALAKIPADSLS